MYCDTSDTKLCTCVCIWSNICFMHWSIYIYGYMWSNICFMHCSMHETVLTIYIYGYTWSNICFMHYSIHETCLDYEWYQCLAYNCTYHHATICFMHETYVLCMKHMFHTYVSSTHESKLTWNLYGLHNLIHASFACTVIQSFAHVVICDQTYLSCIEAYTYMVICGLTHVSCTAACMKQFWPYTYDYRRLEITSL